MKLRIIILITAVIAAASQAMAFDLKSILKGSGKGDNAITNALGSLLSSDKISVADLEGSWSYSAPAVTFKSDNLLKKAGGAAASTAITNKLAPIYKTCGLDRLTLTINADSTFTMKIRNITLKGTISSNTTEGSQSNFVFQFKAAGKIKIGKLDAYIVKNALGKMDLMFDVSKLIGLIEKVGSVSGIKAIKNVSSLLNGYDGLCAGFALKK